MSVSRREFLAYLGAGIVSAAGLVLWSRSRVPRDFAASDPTEPQAIPQDRDAAPPPPEAILASVPDRASAVVLGRAFLESHAAPPGEPSLSVRIWRRVGDAYAARRRRMEGTGPEALRRGIEWAVQDDFRAHRIVNVDGWILAETEANVAALAAMHTEPAVPA